MRKEREKEPSALSRDVPMKLKQMKMKKRVCSEN
jgi:hypothetical protein